MGEKTFDASRYLTNLNGREYLEVKWRLLWLRTEHPDALITTELVEHHEGMAVFKAKVVLPEGGEATGWGSETANDFEDYIEKAETKALGRALAALGYGTQFCEDFEFHRGGEQRVVDAPVERPSAELRPRPAPKVREAKVPRREKATTAQVNAIYIIARTEYGWGEEELNERCKVIYNREPAELTKREASEFIDQLKGTIPQGQPESSPSGLGIGERQ